MKIKYYADEQEWLTDRLGRVTGSRLKDLIAKKGGGRKIGFYELIAERLGIPPEEENALERGHRLEPEALDRFEAATGKKLIRDLAIWTRDDNENIAISPDAWIGKKKIIEAVEVKALSSARHIEALLTQEVPSEYWYQVLQYFVCCDELKTLYLVFYDTRLKCKDFFFLTIRREDVQAEVEATLAYEHEMLSEIDAIVSTLTTF
jgi:predicted phage-related endonuclease